MKKMTTAEIRSAFLNYFAEHGHKVLHSASLVPGNDPTLLFTNAGMVPFKDIFIGAEKRDYKRATTAQKCVRAGGKHNDLENVGYTARHHTFFEMLGNFSFGDYFKREAIPFAWNLLTKVFEIPEEKLLVTIYHEDDEAFKIWHEVVGLPVEKIIRIGDKPGKAKYESDNFWMMGETGPCGPCSEIFYDHGDAVWGGPPGSAEEDGDRFIEIWNIVFMQFERDEKGNLKPLPKPSIDTGMGLERMAAVLQGVHSNYEIDLFRNLIQAAARETGAPFSMEEPSLKVIADHIRACAFLIADGVLPANEGRGYVLRRIIRRACRHGYKLGQTKPFFYRLVVDLVREMGGAYPELEEAQTRIMEVLRLEESRFGQTLEKGLAHFYEVLHGMQFLKLQSILPLEGASDVLLLEARDGSRFSACARDFAGKKQIVIRGRAQGALNESVVLSLDDVLRKDKSRLAEEISPYAHALYDYFQENLAKSKLIIPGDEVFKLYDTYGFPYDLTADMARELGIELDSDGFERAMEVQRNRAKAAGKFISNHIFDVQHKTKFLGYTLARSEAKVVEIFKDKNRVASVESGDEAVLVLDQTPFYGESGGQVGDIGTIEGEGFAFQVMDTQKQGDNFLHFGVVLFGRLDEGAVCQAAIDEVRRAQIKRHHSATHLLHKALRVVLGNHVQQKGSLVDEARTRFDFSHDGPLSADQLRAVEALVNKEILANAPVVVREMAYDEALKSGAMALFGEKYGDRVRVVAMGDNQFSVELCGGTHVAYTAEIGLFKVVSQGAVSSGIRRVECVAGEALLAHAQRQSDVILALNGELKADDAQLVERVLALKAQIKEQEKEVQQLKRRLASGQSEAQEKIEEIGAWRVLRAERNGFDGATLRDSADQLRDKHHLDLVVLAGADEGVARLVVSVSKAAVAKGLHAGKIINQLALAIEGKGGGRPDFAQAGGKNPQGIQAALAKLAEVLSE